MSRRRCTLLSLIAVMALTGCGVLDRPDASGQVTRVQGDDIVVELDVEHPELGDDVHVLMPPDAPVPREGDHVSLWLSLDAIAESDPPQVNATHVEVDG